MESIIRIGRVSDTKTGIRQVRVYFEADEMMSGWLKVLKNIPVIPGNRTSSESGGSGEAAYADHSHSVTVEPWMPNVGDMVVCLYDTTFNGDGYVLGAL